MSTEDTARHPKLGDRLVCCVCRSGSSLHEGTIAVVHGNTTRFRHHRFRLWQCPHCRSIQNIDPVDYDDIYRDYPLNARTLDIFGVWTLGNLVRRLRKSGLAPNHSLLDYGCGSGLLLEILKRRGFVNVTGYDAFVTEFNTPPPADVQFDWVVTQDVIEHAPDIRAFLRDCLRYVRPGGFLYVGTPDTTGMNMSKLQRDITKLHQPFHRVIMSFEAIEHMMKEFDLIPRYVYRRSYMDTLLPFANYRFLDELSRAFDHNLDFALDAKRSVRAVARSPRLMFYGVLGFFFPSTFDPGFVFQKPRVRPSR